MIGPKSLDQMMMEAADKTRQAKGLPVSQKSLPVAPAKFTSQPVQFTESDNHAMTVVFNQLMQIFPGHRKQFQTDEEFSRFKAQFIKGLLDSGIRDRAQFEKAFRKARERIYPTLPTIGEFLSWCQREPEDYGYPTVKQALWEVTNRYRDICPAAMLAGRKTRYERGTLSADKYQDVFATAYRDIVFDAVDTGKDLAAIVANGIESKGPAPAKASQSVAMEALAKIRECLGHTPDKKSIADETEDEHRLRMIKRRRKLNLSISKEDQEFEKNFGA